MAKKFNAITNIADIGLITSPVTVEMVSVTAFVGGVGLPVALSGTSLLFFSLATDITQKSFNMFTIKQERNFN